MSAERIGIDFPPAVDAAAAMRQSAAAPPTSTRDAVLQQIPPIIRSVLEYAHYLMIGHSQYLRATPGYQGGLFYKGKPYCFASGYRDSSRPLEVEDKSNHMRLKDALLYGNLSTPVAAAYLCDLHGRGVFDLTRPLVAYLPELHDKLDDDVTGRSILAYMTVLNDTQVLRDAGARVRWPLWATNVCNATQRDVYDPVRRFFSATSTATTTTAAAAATATAAATACKEGQQQRANLVHYVQTARKVTVRRLRNARHARPSHFAIALLIAAVERELRTRSFEQAIRDDFFLRVDCHGSNYGAPRPWRNPSDLFYQPTGQARQHVAFRKPLPKDSDCNCGPALLNASLNLYAPPEEYAKLLLLSVDTILKARRLLPPLAQHQQMKANATPHYDLGVRHVPKNHFMQLRAPWRGCVNYVPSAAAFRYDTKNDIGCFGVANCGSRNARAFANGLEKIIYVIFRRYAHAKGSDIDKPVSVDDMQAAADADKKDNIIDTNLKNMAIHKIFPRHDRHKNF